MLSPCKHVVVDYNTLIIKIWEDHVESEATRSSVQKVLNVKLIFSLHCIMLLFKLAHTLRKYVIGKDVYISDFVEIIRMCKFKLYEMCNDFEYKFNNEVVKTFHSFLAKNHDELALISVKSRTCDDDWCVMKFNGHQVLVHF
jgi:hypothetical protein